jgi:hypothetical protein
MLQSIPIAQDEYIHSFDNQRLAQRDPLLVQCPRSATRSGASPEISARP